MQKKCEYVIKEINQPSHKSIRQFHEDFYDFMLRTIEAEEKMVITILKTPNSTQKPNES